jgi:hypothetical protein
LEKYEINLAARTVTVSSTLPQDKVQEILEKCGKDVEFIGTK